MKPKPAIGVPRDAAIAFARGFAGCLAFLWLLMEVYSYFALTWLPAVNPESLKASLWLSAGLIVGLTAATSRLVTAVRVGETPAPKPSFEQSLVDALTSALRDRNYAEVIRIGVALNRPLFEEGKFSTRLRIGKVVEEAAALSDRKDIQVVALVDAIGWSQVELGAYDEAKRSIEHGIDISEELGTAFYTAKGYRHLGVIARRTNDYAQAKSRYEQSLAIAKTIADDHDRDTLVAGLNYAIASLHFHTGDYDTAMEFIGRAISDFEKLSDEYRLNMSFVTKGDIQFKQNLRDRAKDTYRTVLQRADKNTEKLQVARSCLGLAEVYISEHDWERAQRSLSQASNIDLKEFKAEAERLRTFKAMLPAPSS
jgi:tetratricopeptide (TPR) repeat protein